LGLVLYRLRRDVQAKWRTFVLLALIVGVGGGVALTALAGAHRTDTAVPRFVAYSRPDNGEAVFGNFCLAPMVSGPRAFSENPLPLAAKVMSLRQVAAYMRTPYLFLAPDASGAGLGSLNLFATADAQGYHRIDRLLMVAGAMPDPSRPFDVVVNPTAADRFHLRVGSLLTLHAYSAAQLKNCSLIAGTHREAPEGPSFTVHVVGIGRSPTDVNAIVPLARSRTPSTRAKG
jgi:putative ABC transport system permease protein